MAKDTNSESRWNQPIYGKMVKDQTPRERLVIRNRKRVDDAYEAGLINKDQYMKTYGQDFGSKRFKVFGLDG